MMMKKLFFSSILMLSLCTTATAQDLHVYYDVYHDSVWFKKGDVITEIPGVRKRDMVHLHVVEFNNYVYNVKTEQKEVNDDSGKTDLVRSFFPESGDPVGDFLKSMPFGKIVNVFSKNSNDDNLGFATSGNEKTPRGDLNLIFDSAGQYVERLENLSEEMISLSSIINTISRKISASTLDVSDIDNLLKNTELPPSMIRKLVKENLGLMFGDEFVEKPTLNGAYSWMNNIDTLRVNSARMSQIIKKWNDDKSEFDKILKKLSQSTPDMTIKGREVYAELQNISDKADLMDLQVTGQADILERIEEMSAGVTIDKLRALYHKTCEMNNHRFEHNETFKPIGREMDLVLNVTVKKVKENDDTDPETYRTKTIRVTNYEGFKYTITPGFSFAGFFTPQKRYSLLLNNDNETVIAETNADKFAPLITTAVQVYNDTGKRITPGALLGLAVPLTQNGGQGQSLNFVLGPSLVIGRDQRISISLGLMGGKTTRLSQGVTPFQPFDSQNGVRPIPTIDRYEFGWYFGVTGNL